MLKLKLGLFRRKVGQQDENFPVGIVNHTNLLASSPPILTIFFHLKSPKKNCEVIIIKLNFVFVLYCTVAERVSHRPNVVSWNYAWIIG